MPRALPFHAHDQPLFIVKALVGGLVGVIAVVLVGLFATAVVARTHTRGGALVEPFTNSCSTSPSPGAHRVNSSYSPYRHGFNNVNSNLLANHKVATSRILQLNAIPCPTFVHVYKRKTPAFVDRLLHAYEIPYPVVVKPVNGNQGTDVRVNLNTATQVAAAIAEVLGPAETGKPVAGVIVEEQVRGMDFRVLMLNHRVFDIVCRMRATVTGDGVRTLAALIARRNRRQERNGRFPTKHVSWTFVAEQLDLPTDPSRMQGANQPADALRTALQGYVVPAGVTVTITNVANNHNGCNPVRVPLGSVHTDNVTLFQRVSRLFGLHMTGLDYMTPDIAISYKDAGHIIEVNSGPGMAVHRTAYPQDKKVTKRFVRALMTSSPQSPYE